MKYDSKLLIKFFILGGIGPLIILFLLGDNYSIKRRFTSIPADEGKYSWVYSQIFEDKSRLDFAFLGSSHTFNAVDDAFLSKQLNKNVKNLAVSYRGRDLQFLLVRWLLQQKHVKNIVVEIDANEPRTGHQNFGLLADKSDIIGMPLIINLGYFKNIALFLRLRINGLMEVFRGNGSDLSPDWSQEYGFLKQENQYGIEELEKRRKTLRAPKETDRLPESMTDYEYAMPLYYLKNICDNAHAANVNILFHYIPYYKAPELPRFEEMYNACGRILIPPVEIFNDPSNWSNVSHLNPDGAKKYSLWLETQLK